MTKLRWCYFHGLKMVDTWCWYTCSLIRYFAVSWGNEHVFSYGGFTNEPSLWLSRSDIMILLAAVFSVLTIYIRVSELLSIMGNFVTNFTLEMRCKHFYLILTLCVGKLGVLGKNLGGKASPCYNCIGTLTWWVLTRLTCFCFCTFQISVLQKMAHNLWDKQCFSYIFSTIIMAFLAQIAFILKQENNWATSWEKKSYKNYRFISAGASTCTEQSLHCSLDKILQNP